MVTFEACLLCTPHYRSARDCPYKKPVTVNVVLVPISTVLYRGVASAYSQYLLSSRLSYPNPVLHLREKILKLSTLALLSRRPLGPCLALELRNLQYSRTFTMAWRSSGSSNQSLIENLEKNGLIETKRVKDAMLQVLPTTILVSRQREQHVCNRTNIL